MRQNFILIFLLLILSDFTSAQILTDSNLPIVIINTDGGVSIPDNPRVKGSMKIINRGGGQRNYVTDQGSTEYLNYNGRIDIEIRGAASQNFQKNSTDSLPEWLMISLITMSVFLVCHLKMTGFLMVWQMIRLL